jgi:uncharacterized protein YndB with AHSA1/START domain
MSKSSSSTDRIEKQIVLRAPRSRVWRALADAEEFGTWFHARFERAFEPGATVRGKILEQGFEHAIEIVVDRIEPEHLFSFRWHPYAVGPAADFAAEPMTLVEFRLEEIADGTRLTVTESGFDGIPAARRAEAFRMNDHGWTIQIERIGRHVAG